jgi:asparagine synthase (glutamine-hydrolysing)
MCGINGILRLRPDSPPLDRGELRRTRDSMARRGPDGTGEWVSPAGLCALGHRRLAILDLSPAGAQPMGSPDERYWIVLNGEIYNFRELRRPLERDGVAFRSQSDTELLLHLYAREGAAMLPRLRGMFALAIWDERERRLLLARDTFGIKPLYYSATADTLRFASQVKALAASGAVDAEVDPAGLVGFLLWGSVPEPHTIRRAVRCLPAGHFLVVEDGRLPPSRPLGCAPEVEPGGSLGDALADSVRAHLVSDVPVAVFLSAGLDSSLIAALASRISPEPLASFTLSFDVLAGSPLDEAPLAAETARRLGLRHVERRIGKRDFEELWPQALAAMDQPSIDGFNVFLVSRAAHQAGIKVALTGLGGDELFGSYPSFRQVPRLARWTRAAAAVPGLPAAWSRLAAGAIREHPKLRGLLRHGATLAGSYFLRRGLFLPEELPALLGPDLAGAGLARYDPIADAARHIGGAATGNGDRPSDPWLAVQRMETAQYMRNQLLRDADWASMAHSLELRVPLVDPWLAAAVAAARFQPGGSHVKAAVVRDAAPELPPAVLQRAKTGFYVPMGEWLRPADRARHTGGRSRRLALDLLSEFGATPARVAR